MRMLWREAAISALLAGTLAGCASPQYSIDPNQASSPAPLASTRPQYSIDPRSPDPGQAPRPAAAPAASTAQDEPDSAPLAAPVAPVQSESLPAPAPGPAADATPPSRMNADGARLQYADMTTPADAGGQPMSTTSSSLPPAAPPPASTATDSPTPTPAPPPADASLTPQMVVHDQSAVASPAPPPAPRHAGPVHAAAAPPPATERPASGGARFADAGQVVHAAGVVFENYEVQRGDHIDALARAFSTTRSVLLNANSSLRPPYPLHPGQILKVPVAKAYVARGGDTLTGVAKRFSVNPEELAELNHVNLHAPLRAGQEIGLPSSMHDRGPQRVSGSDSEYAEADQPPPVTRQVASVAQPSPVTRRSASDYQPSPPQSAVPLYHPSPVVPAPDHRVVQVAPAPAMPTPRSTSSYVASSSPPPPAASGYSDSEIAAAARGRFVWPVRGDVVQRFGPQGVGRRNDGVDIKAAQGTPVKAAAAGEVVYAGDQVPGFGNLVLIKHADGWVTAYAHLDSVEVAMKQEVMQGQSLGSVGMSGGAVQPELHFEVRYAPSPADKAKPVDPVLVLPMG